MPVLSLSVESREAALSVRRFSVHEAISTLFQVTIHAASRRPDVDIAKIVGKRASFRIVSGIKGAKHDGARKFTGVVSYMEQMQAVPEGRGESTYYVQVAPKMWKLTQRHDHRIYQHMSIPEIVKKVLDKFRIPAKWKIDTGRYPKLEYRVQYGESDYAFVCRLLEEAGISFFFLDVEDDTIVVFTDAPQEAKTRGAIWFEDSPTESAEREYVSEVRVAHQVRPGNITIRDFDFRRPNFQLVASSKAGHEDDDELEEYHYVPGAFLAEGGKGGDSPVADDKATSRHDAKQGASRAERALAAARGPKLQLSFESNVVDLWPGAVFSIENHPREELEKRLLVLEYSMEGSPSDEWTMSGQAVTCDRPFHPANSTPKPRVQGLQSAMVVGPPGQEIHTDEFGRVRVQFHWDRDAAGDENGSCWMRVSQGWGGSGYGMIALPRVGQEVLVAFLEGDPDHPIVVGRVFNSTSPVPYKLPEQKTVSGWKSDSSPHTGGYNELRFDDAAGNELVHIQAEKNLTKLVKENETETTGVNRTIQVGVNRTAMVGATDSTLVGANYSITIAQPPDPPPTIPPTGQAMSDKRVNFTTGEATFTMDGPNVTLSANGNVTLDAKGSIVQNAAANITVNAAATITLGAGASITIKAAGGDVVITGGPMVKINP